MSDPDSPTICSFAVREDSGHNRDYCIIRHGLPIARGAVHDIQHLILKNSQGAPTCAQFTITEYWPDRSIKWLLVTFETPIKADSTNKFDLELSEAENELALPLLIQDHSDTFIVDTHKAIYKVSRRNQTLLESVSVDGKTILNNGCFDLYLETSGKRLKYETKTAEIEENGVTYAAIIKRGNFLDDRDKVFARFILRLIFRSNSSVVETQVTIHNPRPAYHPGGLWDLGDKGSVLFDEFAINATIADTVCTIETKPEPKKNLTIVNCNSQLVIHQNSSGGQNWYSPNHMGSDKKITTSYRGYRVISTSREHGEQILTKGKRATPWLQITGETNCICAAIEHFWQNFPNSIRGNNKTINISFFPREQGSPYELQGGEQKRHTAFIEFKTKNWAPTVEQYLDPPFVTLDPKYLESTKVLSYFAARNNDSYQVYEDYVQTIVEGSDSFFSKHEIIDEFGWRNFGDQYADHEAVNHQDKSQFISHYNNQYDFIFAAALQALRTGDKRWAILMAQQARHTIDIDVYRTQGDKHSYNGGLFWHTDHHQNCSTSTHRSYTKEALKNSKTKGSYGGGPSNEHNYTTGLLHYYYLSGDNDAAETVIGLADWVLALDDGKQSLFSIFCEDPTGLASQTVDVNFHHPGRGAGNSINALLDGYRLSSRREYLTKAEELITRCIHPEDHIELLDLDDPEFRWSYLVFLQVLGKYLDYKSELGEIDYFYFYTKESLLHYADWMLLNEKPYKSVLHKVLLPTETWPAHDVRKSHVLFLAAKYCNPDDRKKYRKKAKYFFQNGLTDLLSFSTAYLARPRVILATYGYIFQYFSINEDTVETASHNYNFGSPTKFKPQKAHLKTAFQSKVKLAKSFIVSKLPSGLR